MIKIVSSAILQLTFGIRIEHHLSSIYFKSNQSQSIGFSKCNHLNISNQISYLIASSFVMTKTFTLIFHHKVIFSEILLLELRQYKNDTIQSKVIPTLILPRFFTTFTAREKARRLQN